MTPDVDESVKRSKKKRHVISYAEGLVAAALTIGVMDVVGTPYRTEHLLLIGALGMVAFAIYEYKQ